MGLKQNLSAQETSDPAQELSDAELAKKAIELGCKRMFTETGEAVEGDPQHSYKNILKAGFTESVLRENYAPKK